MKFCSWPVGLTLLVLTASYQATPQQSAQSHCYRLKNESSVKVQVSFEYDDVVPEGGPIHLGLPPGGVYPKSGEWCWDTPDGYYATVTFSGNVTPSWKGTLIMGNGDRAYPSGTYTFQNPKDPTTGKAGACIPNKFPGNDKFCLVSGGKAIQINCPYGSGKRVGSYSAITNMKIRCNNGRKWTLTCIEGGRICNLNSSEICNGLSQWDVGQHCTENGAAPNGW
jgi:hypothetical protein